MTILPQFFVVFYSKSLYPNFFHLFIRLPKEKRAYDAFGKKVGSKECKEGKIFIESQGFCVLADVGVTEGHAK